MYISLPRHFKLTQIFLKRNYSDFCKKLDWVKKLRQRYRAFKYLSVRNSVWDIRKSREHMLIGLCFLEEERKKKGRQKELLCCLIKHHLPSKQQLWSSLWSAQVRISLILLKESCTGRTFSKQTHFIFLT